MKYTILILLISLFAIHCNAQTNRKEKLKIALQKEKTDTGRVLLLSDLAFEYLESKPDTIMKLALEGLSISRRIGFKKGEAISLNRVGNAYADLSNFPKAMETNLQALKINEKINNPDGIARNLNNIGRMETILGDYRLALNYFLKAVSIEGKTNDKKGLSSTYCNIGNLYLNCKKYDSARLFEEKSYDVASAIQDGRLRGESLFSLGNIFSETGQNKLALEYYRLCIPDLEKADVYIMISWSYLQMATIFKKIGSKDSAFIYAKRSFISAKEKGFKAIILEASYFLTTFYRNTRNLDSAFYYQDIAKAIDDSLFGNQKVMQLQSLAFDEKLRQVDKEAAQLKASEERKNNLQFVAIAIGLITFIVLFFALSRSIIVKTKFIEFFSVLGLLAVFEFINLYIHPYLVRLTNDSQFLMLGMLISIGALLIPMHHRLENWITKVMVEKNKKIRLAAAKNTIAKLEGGTS